MVERPPLRAWKTMEFAGESLAGEEQPQCVSRSKENRRVRKRRQSRPEAAAATIPNATGCCQSIHAQHTPRGPPRNREFLDHKKMATHDFDVDRARPTAVMRASS